MFESKAKAYMSTAVIRYSIRGQAPVLTHNYQNKLEKLARGKASGLF
jgi:hypothetical protein